MKYEGHITGRSEDIARSPSGEDQLVRCADHPQGPLNL